MTLFLPVGPPGSGKSWLAKQLVSGGVLAPTAVISTDDLRGWMTGSSTDQSANGEVWDIARRVAHERLKRGLNVYFDATNLNPDWYDKMLALAHEKGHRVLFILFDTPYSECRNRNTKRGIAAIPDLAVDKMIEQHKAISADLLRDAGDVITGSDYQQLVAGIRAWIGGETT